MDSSLGTRNKMLCDHYCTKARIDYQRGHYSRAIKHAQRARKADSNAVEPYKIIANALAKKGDHEAASRLVEKARQRLSGPQRVQRIRADPMQRLDMDTQVQILSYLSFRGLVSCMRVSKTWHNVITSDNAAHLWKHLNTYYPECVKLPRVTPEFVKSCIRYAQKGGCQGITSATLNCPGSHYHILKLMMLNCTNLEKLVLIRAEFPSASLIFAVSKMSSLTTLLLSAQVQISPDVVPQLFRDAPHLVDVQISGIRTVSGGTRLLQWHSGTTKLKKLRLGIPGNRTDFRDFNMPGLARIAPDLQLLYLEGSWMDAGPGAGVMMGTLPYPQSDANIAIFRFFDKLQHLIITHARFCASPPDELFKPPSALRTLRIERTCRNEAMWTQFFATPLPHVEELVLTGLGAVPASKVGGMLSLVGASNPQQLSKLKRLHIRLREFMFDTDSAQMLFRMPRLAELVELHIAYGNFGNKVAKTLANTLTHLQRLHIKYGNLTGVGIKKIVLANKSLKFLELSDCEFVSPDADEWVRSLGIEVVRTSTPAKGAYTLKESHR